MCACTGTVYYGTWESIELSAWKQFASKEVDGSIICSNGSFNEDPVWGEHKSCYCKHKNPSFLDEELQFNFKIDFADKDRNFPYEEKWSGGAKIEFEDYQVRVNKIKHDKLARKDACTIDFTLEEF